ncbi:hypothetical protein BU23DRAFT_541767 [Bimuria novae-zelandiae CBS 107.79]|uniref:Rhodopsin domain-containing protein n=1 Tax=Bimuria novae-zelandiae CBS 107.79 TaxID=1447943 RepID=A0A6A5UYQ5_9PLEO|nr:hypothetical protein BU23DRAFT_541767 [Bimuria novae-zelandiae CBS 107.79]
MSLNTRTAPSGRAAHIAWEFSVIATTLLATATLLFVARLWTRFSTVYRMLADDYVCAIAYVLVVVNTGLFLKSIEWALPTWTGDPSKMTLRNDTYVFYGVIAQPFWACGMASIKISIALFMLRLEPRKQCCRFLWAMIAFQVVLSVYNVLTQLISCRPLRAKWANPGDIPGRCWPNNVDTASQVTVQAFVILTDWVFALLPISFLRKVQRPLRERAIIWFLMSLGIFAGVSSIIKIQQILAMRNGDDISANAITIEMWCSIEALTGFIASCVPCLRGPFQRVLEHFGVVKQPQTSTSTSPHYPDTSYGTHVSSGKAGSGFDPSAQMKQIGSSAGDSSEKIILRNEPAARNGEIWCTTEVLMEEEERLKTP